MNTENNVAPVLEINNDGTMTIIQDMTIGDILTLLDAARNGILGVQVKSTDTQPVPMDDLGKTEE